jgi:hypothetical protein
MDIPLSLATGVVIGLIYQIYTYADFGVKKIREYINPYWRDQSDFSKIGS